MPVAKAEETLAATEQLLKDARSLLDGDESRANAHAGVLGLYEALCRGLEGIDGERVRVLLGRIAQQVEGLNDLAADVERIRRLRKSIRSG